MHTKDLIKLLVDQEAKSPSNTPIKLSIYATNNVGKDVLVMREDSSMRITGASNGSGGSSVVLKIDGCFVDATTEALIKQVNALEDEIASLKQHIQLQVN